MWDVIYDKSLSWEERLKVAFCLWRRTDHIPDRTKRLCLFEWTSESVATFYKIQSDRSSGVFFWRLSAELLEMLSGPVVISLPFLKAMTQALEEDKHSALTMAVVDCLSPILSLNPKPAVLHKIEVLLPLAVALIQSVLHYITSSGIGDGSPNTLYDPLANLLDNLAYLQSVNGNPKKVFMTTCQSLLCPLLSLNNSLSAEDHTSLSSSLYKVIRNLFTRDHLNEYLSVIVQDTPTSQSSKGIQNYTWHLIRQLNMMYENPDTRVCVLKGVPLLLKAMITQNRAEGQLSSQKEFKLFVLFLGVVGLNKYSKRDIEQEQEQEGDDLLSVKKVLTEATEEATGTEMEVESKDPLLVLDCVCECLEIVQKENVYQISEDQDGVYLVHLKQILTLVTSHFSLNDLSVVNSWYKVLSILSSLNHRLIVPLLSSLWGLFLCLNNNGYKQDLSSVELFYLHLIKLYSKLRQLPKLVEELLGAIREIYERGPGQPLPSLSPFVQRSLQAPLASLPETHCLSLVQLLTNTLMEYYLPLLCGGELLDVNKKRRRRMSGEDTPTSLSRHDHFITCVNCVINVMATVLHLLPFDVFGKGRHNDELLGVVCRLIKSVCLPLMDIASRKSVLQGSALYLFLTVSEVLYSLRAVYPNLVVPSDVMGTGLVSWERDPEPTPRPVCWEGQGVEVPYSPLTDVLLRELCLLSLRFGLNTEEDASLFLNYLTSTLTAPQEPWDGQVLSVTSSNHSTASWCLLLQDLPVISSLITCREVWRRIASAVMQLTKTHSQTSVGTKSVDIRMKTVDDLLISAPYFELRGLHSQLVLEAMSQAGRMWPKTYFKAMRECFISLSSDGGNVPLADTLELLINNNNEEECPLTNRETRKLTNFLNFVPSCLKVIGSVPVSRSHVGHVTSLVCRLSLLSIAVKEAVRCLNYPMEVLSLVILSLSQLLHKLSYILATSKKGQSSTGLNCLLPWLLEVGKMASECNYKELVVLALVAMEKTLECQLMRREYPNEFVKLLRKDSFSSSSDFSHKCFVLLECISSIVSPCSAVLESTDQQYFIKQINKCRKHINKRSSQQQEKAVILPVPAGHANWKLLQSNLLSLLEGSPPHLQFLYHKQIFSCDLSSARSQARLPGVEFLEKWMRRFQKEGDEEGWGLMVGVASNLSMMIRTLEEGEEEDIVSIFKTIRDLEEAGDVEADSHVCSRTHSRLVWILCWLCVLESRLKQSGKMALLRCNTRIVIRAVHYIIQSTDAKCCHGNNTLIMVTGLRLLGLLAAIPVKVGLNSRTVVVLLHVFSGLSETVLSSSSPVVLLVCQQLLSTLVLNHSPVLDRCSPAILPAVLKCLRCNISVAQSPPVSGDIGQLEEVILSFVRLIELLSRQLWFSRNAVYCIAQYLTSSQQAPLDRKLKDSLVSGLLLLFKLLTESDKHYLLSSLEEQGRETLQNLFDEYKKFYRFKGIV